MNVFLSCELYPDGTPYKSDEVDFVKSLINRQLCINTIDDSLF